MENKEFKNTEEKILKFWKKNEIFRKSMEQRKNAKPFVFFEGPPTANGLPHIGHFLTRAFKDLYGRYKTMRGFYVLRRAGWDTHGLPVEIEVEKQLGLSTKKDIEGYGIAKFNKKAKESVWKYKNEWEKMTERMGFWINLKHPYITYDTDFIESVWQIIKQISDKKLLFQGHKVLPYCTRCGTTLSSHEVAQGYKDITETSVFIKFKVKQDDSYLLAWTTTPWTLPGNVALAISEKITYVLAEKNGEKYILAKDLISVLGENTTIVREFPGKELVGLEYEPLFNIKNLQTKKSYRVYPADFVTTTDGTGIVHTAVMYGEEDYELGKKIGLPTYHTVDERGYFVADVPEFAGQYTKMAEKGIIEYLRRKDLLFKTQEHAHTYPFCWRCDTALLYYAKDSWFIKMSSLRKKLVQNNQKINWQPSHIRDGRFGEFIKEAKDWAFSRARYWGTPLPIWQCQSECGHIMTIGSFDELEKYRFKTKNVYLLLRHGKSTKEIAGESLISSKLEHDKYDLTAEGVEQIKTIARKLKKEGLPGQGGVDLIIASPFIRTKHSAQIVSEYLNIEYKTDKRLKEADHGIFWEGKPLTDSVREQLNPSFDAKSEDGESLRDIRKRMASLLAELEQKYEGKKILLVSHGDPIWLASCIAQNIPENEITKTNRHLNYPTQGTLKQIELKNVPRNDEGVIDPHRPFVDEILLKCPKCKGSMKRIPELADAWLDSGSMPYAQWHYPFENKDLINGGSQFPADFIVEAIDQTRGWFYTLLAVATAIGRKSPFKNVIVLGHVQDAKGQKMSKSKGNVLLANDAMEEIGADAFRWYFYTVSGPEDSKPVSVAEVEKKLRGFTTTLQNILRFYQLYTNNQLAVGKNTALVKPIHILDQWLNAKLQKLINHVSERLDAYDPLFAARAIEEFIINDLSNWWVRRSRERFQRPENSQQLSYVASILRQTLFDLAKLLAPFIPFTAEEIYRPSAEVAGALSIHLQNWPKVKKLKPEEETLINNMGEVRRFVTEGLAQRKVKQLKVRQPLAGITLKRVEKFDVGLEALLMEELNVKSVLYDDKQADELVLDENITPELRLEGYAREAMRQIQDLRKEAKYRLDEKVFVGWESDNADVILAMKNFGADIARDTLLKELTRGHQPKTKFDIEKDTELAKGAGIWLGVKK